MTGQFVIAIEPTREKIIVNGTEFRLFKGRTNTGIELEMLGLFRVLGGADKKAEFERTVCSVDPGDPPPTRLLSANGLVNP